MRNTLVVIALLGCMAVFLPAQWRRGARGTQDSAAQRQGRNTGARNPEILSISTVVESGGRVDWSESRNLIAFDRLDARGYFKIWVMRPDGSDQRCVTCNNPELTKHNGNPAWDPSGRFIAFEAQNDFRGLLPKMTDYFANPGAGVNDDLWVMDFSTGKAWQLTHLPPRTGGVLHPHFSHNGNYLLWSERYAPGGGKFGLWRIKMARFVINGGVPSITDERSLTPGKQKQFYETHGFSKDDRTIYFSANLTPGQDVTGDDIYAYNVESGDLRDLTNAPEEWDEHAQLSPSGKRIVWMTNRDLPKQRTPYGVRSDYWIMNADGSDPSRLTYFNTPGSPEYIEGGITAADSSWGPDGRQLVATLIEDARTEASRIVMIQFRDPQ